MTRRKSSPPPSRGSNRQTSSSSSSSRKRGSSSPKRTSSSRTSNRRPAPNPARREPLLQLSRHQWAIILGILLIALAGVAILSGLSISRGKLTDWIWDTIWHWFGYGGLAIPVVLGLGGLYLVLWGMEQPPAVRWVRIGGASVIFVALEGLLHLVYLGGHPTATVEQVAELGEGGGYLGGGLVTLFEAATGRVGAWVLCLALIAVGVIIASGMTFAELGRRAVGLVQTARERLSGRPTAVRAPTLPTALPLRESRPQQPPLPLRQAAPPGPPPAREPELPLDMTQPGLFYGDAVRMAYSDYVWQLPAVTDILEPGTESTTVDIQIREQAEIIEHTLASFGAPARIVEVNRGPVITQFGVEPQYVEQRGGRRVKVKVGQISSLADDLALALAASSIRIEAPVPGKGFVGIEVPNPEASIVSLRDVMESERFGRVDSRLRIGLGQDVSGHAIAADLTQMPHLLIAGTTGSGKSVCVNSLVTCLLLNNAPTQLRLLMVDPKRVELTNYNGVPHLLTPVVVDLDKVVGALQWVSREMDGRYHQFAEIGARNIAEHNRRALANGGDEMPYIVVVIDELADLMIMAPEETERTVCRLAQMARATGIHLIIATQRPSVDVVTGLIKANFPARIAFAVASSTDSRVILDTTGAERLLGRGDMLLMTPESAQPVRMQGCYVSDAELHRLVDFWRRQRLAAVQAGKAARQQVPAQAAEEPGELAAPELAPAELGPAESVPPPLQQPLWEDVIQMEKEAGEQDELLDQAIEIVRELGKASVSLLQRRLRIGYTRAARLVDEMEARGVVGPHPGGSRQRDVLPTPSEPAEE